MKQIVILGLFLLSFTLPTSVLSHEEAKVGIASGEDATLPPGPDIRIIINIPARKLTLLDEGKVVERYDVAVGQPIYKTPKGPQEITELIWNPWWIPPDSPWAAGERPDPPGPKNTLGPLKLPMGQGIRLHGTNKESSVGKWASHGCIRMRNSDVVKLGWYIQKRINNDPDELLEKYKKYNRTSFYVKLLYPVKVDIVYEPVEIVDGMIHIYPNLYGWAGDVKTEVLKAASSSGIDVGKLDLVKLESIRYPKKGDETVTVPLTEVVTSGAKETKYVSAN